MRIVNELQGIGSEGSVEICFNNSYGGICDTFWDDANALVVCKQLGFSANGIRND